MMCGMTESEIMRLLWDVSELLISEHTFESMSIATQCPNVKAEQHFCTLLYNMRFSVCESFSMIKEFLDQLAQGSYQDN